MSASPFKRVSGPMEGALIDGIRKYLELAPEALKAEDRHELAEVAQRILAMLVELYSIQVECAALDPLVDTIRSGSQTTDFQPPPVWVPKT